MICIIIFQVIDITVKNRNIEIFVQNKIIRIRNASEIMKLIVFFSKLRMVRKKSYEIVNEIIVIIEI